VVASLNNAGSHFYQNINLANKPVAPVVGQTVINVTSSSDVKTDTTGIPSKTVNGVVSNGSGSLANGTSKQRVVDGYVGFANLPNQVYRYKSLILSLMKSIHKSNVNFKSKESLLRKVLNLI